MPNEISNTSYTPTTTAADSANASQATADFKHMSVEDIMFLVMTKRAEAQKANIDSFAAEVQANTLKATNFNNFKAAIDKAAKNKHGADIGSVTVNWENANGSTETISASQAATRLGYSNARLDQATAGAARETSDQSKVNSDQSQFNRDGGWGGAIFGNGSAARDERNLRSDQSKLNHDKSDAKISQDDLETLSANLANAHDKIAGDNQIAMAKLQKDMDDYQTTITACSQSVKGMTDTNKSVWRNL
jgi:DNA integrity scanning protein DisA with diadenylate cyclase activity